MKFFLTKCLLIWVVFTSTATAFAQEVLTNKEIISLQIAKISQDIILAKIATSKCTFDLTTQGIIELDAAKLSDRVIKNMFIASPPKGVLLNQDIIRIANSDVSTSLLKDAIKLSPHSFELSPEALINLKNQKVPDSVVKDMILSPSSEGATIVTEVKPSNNTTSITNKIETVKCVQNQGKDIIVTNAFEEVKGLKRMGEFKATASQIFGSQDKLRVVAMEKVKKDARDKGVTHLLIQSDVYAPSPANTVSIICIGYK